MMKHIFYLIFIALALTACSNENEQYEEALLSRDYFLLEKFKNRYPNSIYLPKIDSLIYLIKYEQAIKLNVIKNYKNYLDSFLNSPYFDSVKNFLYQMEWDSIQDDKSSYKKYITEYNKSPYVEAAKSMYRIKSLEDSLIFSENKSKILQNLEYELVEACKQGKINTRFSIPVTFTEKNKMSTSTSLIRAKDITGDYLLNKTTLIYHNPFPNVNSELISGFSEQTWDRILINGGLQIFGLYSVHRFIGSIKFPVADFEAIVGKGDIYNRLTFLLLEDKYIYLRGKGEIIKKNGDVVKLGF